MSLTIVMLEKRFCSEQIMLVTPTQVTTIYQFQAAFTNDLLVQDRGRKPTIWLQPTLLHKSPQAAADRGQSKFF